MHAILFQSIKTSKNNLFMKSITLLVISLFVTLLVNAQVSKTVELTAGSLATILNLEELREIKNG